MENNKKALNNEGSKSNNSIITENALNSNFKAKREGFVFYGSYFEALQGLSDASQLNLYRAIVTKSLYDNEIELNGIEKNLFALMRPQIEANIRKYVNGCKGGGYGKLGGAPKGNKNAEKQPQNDPITTPNVNENANENSKVNVNKILEHYKEVFNKNDYLISIRQKNEIIKISEENDLANEHWQKIFDNASRGWTFTNNGERTHSKPNFDKILENWEKFYNGEYNLDKSTKKTKMQLVEATTDEELKCDPPTKGFLDLKPKLQVKITETSTTNRKETNYGR